MYLTYNTPFPNPLLCCPAHLIMCKHTSTWGYRNNEKDDDHSNNNNLIRGPRRAALPLFRLNRFSPIYFLLQKSPHIDVDPINGGSTFNLHFIELLKTDFSIRVICCRQPSRILVEPYPTYLEVLLCPCSTQRSPRSQSPTYKEFQTSGYDVAASYHRTLDPECGFRCSGCGMLKDHWRGCGLATC